MVDRDIRDRVIAHLDEAIEKHWIQVYYQPVIRTIAGELCGMEALARWVDPQIGFLSPGSFIPVLEQVRLIHRLDGFVFEEVCRTLRQRLDKNLPITPVSFNLSRYDFDMMDVFAFIENTRRKYAVPRDFLHIEITESVLAQDSRVIQQALTNLRQEGYEIWLDDFGSGYSSLNILKDYTVDLIKLDMGFLRSFTEKSRSIISSVIGMAKDLGIKTLAEGVETQEHADFLASIARFDWLRAPAGLLLRLAAPAGGDARAYRGRAARHRAAQVVPLLRRREHGHPPDGPDECTLRCAGERAPPLPLHQQGLPRAAPGARLPTAGC